MDNNSSSLPTFYNINICPETKEQEDISQYIPFDKCEKCTYYIIDHNKYLYCECDKEIPKENIHIGEVTGIHMPIPPGQLMYICDKLVKVKVKVNVQRRHIVKLTIVIIQKNRSQILLIHLSHNTTLL